MCTKQFVNGLQSRNFTTFDDLSDYLEEKSDECVEQTLGPKPNIPWDKQQLFQCLKEPFFYRDGKCRRKTFFQCSECCRIFPDAKIFEFHEKQHAKIRKYAALNGGRKGPLVLPFSAGELSSDRAAQRNSRGPRSGRGRQSVNGTSRSNGNGNGGNKGRAKKDRYAAAPCLNGDPAGGPLVSAAVGKRAKANGKGVRKKITSRLETSEENNIDGTPPFLDDPMFLPGLDAPRGRRKNVIQDDLCFDSYQTDVHTFDEKDPEFRKPGSRAPSRKRKNGKPNGMRDRHVKRGGAPILQAEEEYDITARRQAGSAVRSRRPQRTDVDEYELDKDVPTQLASAVKHGGIEEEYELDKDAGRPMARGGRSRRPEKRLAVDEDEDDPFLPPVLDDETALGFQDEIGIFHQEVRAPNAGADRRKKRKKKRRSHNTVLDAVVADESEDRGHPPLPPVLLPAPLTPNMPSPDVFSPGLLTPHGSISPVTGRLSRGATDEETGSEGDFPEMSELYKRNLPPSGTHASGSQSLPAWVSTPEVRGELSPSMSLDGSPSPRQQIGPGSSGDYAQARLPCHHELELKPLKVILKPLISQPPAKKPMKSLPTKSREDLLGAVPTLSSQTAQQVQQVTQQAAASNSQSRNCKVQSTTQAQVHPASSQQNLPPPHLVVQKSGQAPSSSSNPAMNSSTSSTTPVVPTSTKRQPDNLNRVNGHRAVPTPADHRPEETYNPADLLPRSPKVSRSNRVRMTKPQSPNVGSASGASSGRENASDFVYDGHDQVPMNKLSSSEAAVAQRDPPPSPYASADRTPGVSLTPQASNACPSFSTSPGSSTMINHGKKKFLRLSGSKDSDGNRVSYNKDRVYNPDEHCGVADANGEPCKKSLTCKKHKINERRNVQGRSQSFDTLLRLHREMAAKTPEGPEAAVSKPAVFSARCQTQATNAQLPGTPAPLIDLGPNLDLEDLDSLNQQSLFNPDAVPASTAAAMPPRINPDAATARMPVAPQPSADQTWQRPNEQPKQCRHPRLRYVNTLAERRRMVTLSSISKNLHRDYRWFHCWRAMAHKNIHQNPRGFYVGDSIQRLKSLSSAWRQGVTQATENDASASGRRYRLSPRIQPYSNIGVRPSFHRRYADLTLLRHMSVHLGVQTLPPRPPPEVAPQHQHHQQQSQPLQQQQTAPTTVIPTTRQPESHSDLVACQIFAGYPNPRPPMHQLQQQQQQQQQTVSRVAVQAAPRIAQDATYNFTASPQPQIQQQQQQQQVRIQTSHQAVAGHVRQGPVRQTTGGPVCRNGSGDTVVTGVNLVNSRATGGQPVYFEFQSAGDPTTVSQQPQQGSGELQVGYPVIRGGAGAGASARGMNVRASAAMGANAGVGSAVHGRRRPSAQQVRLPASAVGAASQSQPQQQQQSAQQPQQQQLTAPSAPARSSQHHVVVQQQTTQPQIIRRAASLSATPNTQQQQQQQQSTVIPQATTHQVVHATSIAGSQLQQQQQQQRYVRVVSRTMPADYQTSLALATASGGGPNESDDDCQIIEMSAGRPVSIQQHPSVHQQQQQRLAGSGAVGQYPQMVHRVLPAAQQQASGSLQTQQQQPTGQIYRRVTPQSQVVHRQVQQQQPAQAGVTAHVQFASATPETLQIRQQPHVVQVRQSSQQQQQTPQVVAAQSGATGLESGLLRQRILQQRHEEHQQQQIRQQVFQQQQQLSLDSQRQRSAVAVTSLAQSNIGEVYLQSRVQGHTQFAAAGGALRRPIVGAAAGGIQSGARVLTSAQAGVGVNGATFRNGNGNGDLYAVSNASEMGRQNSFQSTELQQQQVVESADSSLYSPEPIHPSSSRARIAPPSMLGTGGTTLSQQRLIVPTGTTAASTPRRLLAAQYPSSVTVVQASALQQHQPQQQQPGAGSGATQQVLITEESATGHRVLTQPGTGRGSSGIPTVVFVEPDLSAQTGSAVQQFAAAVPQSGNGQQLQGSIVVTGQPRVVTATTNGPLQAQPAIRHRLVTHLAQHRPATSFSHQQPAAPHM